MKLLENLCFRKILNSVLENKRNKYRVLTGNIKIHNIYKYNALLLDNRYQVSILLISIAHYYRKILSFNNYRRIMVLY